MDKKHVTIAGFGASMTEAREMEDENKRWLNILGEKLRASFPEHDFTMVNSGKGGNSAREAMARIEADVLVKNPDYVVLDLTANNTDPANPARRVDLEEFEALLEKYKASIPAKTRTVAFTIPPMFEDIHPYGKRPEFKEFFLMHGGFENIGAPHREAFVAFAKRNGFPVYDSRREFLELGKKNGRERYIYKDGIHLNEEGNKIMAEGLFKILRPLIAEENRGKRIYEK